MSDSDLVKLNRILGMLGSEHAGERAAAALAAHRLVRSMGATWAGLLGADRLGDRRRPTGSAVVRVHEWGVDHAQAAESRVRQLQGENERLRKELATLKRRQAGLAAAERRARLDGT